MLCIQDCLPALQITLNFSDDPYIFLPLNRVFRTAPPLLLRKRMVAGEDLSLLIANRSLLLIQAVDV